jgi:hypothetical protein
VRPERVLDAAVLDRRPLDDVENEDGLENGDLNKASTPAAHFSSLCSVENHFPHNLIKFR